MILTSEKNGSNLQNNAISSNNPYEPEPVRHGQPSWPGEQTPIISKNSKEDTDDNLDYRKESKWENKIHEAPNDRKI